MELKTYYLGLLRKGPIWTAQESPELDALQAAHMAHVQHNAESGKAIASGPVDDGSDIRGITIYRTATLAEAEAIAHSDPGVRVGRFVVELHPWFVPAGYLPDPETPPQG